MCKCMRVCACVPCQESLEILTSQSLLPSHSLSFPLSACELVRLPVEDRQTSTHGGVDYECIL